MYNICPFLGSESINDSQNNAHGQYVCLGGKDYWIPVVSDEIKPKKGSLFPSSEAVDAMYARYALEAGFDVRKTTNRKKNGMTRLRYLMCNRKGVPSTSPVDTLDPLKFKSKRRSDT